jgi:hypothetical protein
MIVPVAKRSQWVWLADRSGAADMMGSRTGRPAVAKNKKAKAKDEKPRLELIAGGDQPAKGKGKKKDGKKAKDAKHAKEHGGGLDAIGKVLDHPLVGDLIAIGALAAVAAIAESGKSDPAKVKSADAAKSAAKAAAAAIGARLLKEVTGGGEKKAEPKA